MPRFLLVQNHNKPKNQRYGTFLERPGKVTKDFLPFSADSFWFFDRKVARKNFHGNKTKQKAGEKFILNVWYKFSPGGKTDKNHKKGGLFVLKLFRSK